MNRKKAYTYDGNVTYPLLKDRLQRAAEWGNLREVKEIIEGNEIDILGDKVDINAYRSSHKTALYTALIHGNTEVAEYLMQYEEAIWPAVECAVINNELPTLKSLIEGQNLNVNYQPTEESQTALHLAARYCHTDIVQYLVEQGAEISAICKSVSDTEWRMFDASTDVSVKYLYPVDVIPFYTGGDVRNYLENLGKTRGYKYKKPRDFFVPKGTKIVENEQLPLDSCLRKTTPEITTNNRSKPETEHNSENPTNDSIQTSDKTKNSSVVELNKLAVVQMLYEALLKCDDYQLKQMYDMVAPKMDRQTQQKVQALFKDKLLDK